MKRASYLLITLAAVVLTFGRVSAAETALSEGTVIRVTGQAKIMLPGQTAAVDLTSGMKVPQGATITTGDGEVYLQVHTGTVAMVKSNSTVSVDELSVTTADGKVTKETTALNLRNGNLVSMLDPAKKAVNSYQVRTPKGVAAARGTTFTVSYNGVNYTIIATTGFVQITSSTGAVVSISGGQASLSSVNGGAATAVGDLPAAQKAEAVQAMTVAVATIAVAVENNMLGSGGSTQLADAAATVIRAEPSTAATITQLVAVSAPSQNNVIEQTVRDNPPPPPSTTTPPPPPPPITTPQPIDPTTISPSG